MQNTNDSVETKSIKKCPHCRKEVDLKATKCPHCQSDMRSWINRHPIVTLLLVLFIVPFMIVSVSDKSTPPSQEESIANLKMHDFAKLAKMNVESTLKAPSTAKFNTSPTVTQDAKKKNSFEIESYVDSQNGFGAMIRSYWSVKAHYIGADDSDSTGTGANWKIDEFIFDGKKIQ